MEEKRKTTPPEKEKPPPDQVREWQFDTQQIRAGEDPYPSTIHSLRTPIYATKSYTYSTMSEMLKNNYFYSRTENPTLYALDKKLATLHGGEEALSVASGMAAVHLSLSSVFQDRIDRMKPRKIQKYYPQNNPTLFPNIIIHKQQYTGVFRLLTKIYPQMGNTAISVDMCNLEEVESAITEQTKAVFFETPTNPSVDIIDIDEISKLIHGVGGKCIVDNTFASPALQQPIKLGADLVIESLTKYVNGHGDCLGGVIVGPKKEIRNIRYFWQETQGPVMSPFSAWLILRGVRTLSLRMEKHCSNATKIAKFLSMHPKVKKVIYPGLESHSGHIIAKKQMTGFGGMLGFELETVEECYELMELFKLIKVGVSLGDTTSLIEYTSIMTGIDLASWEKRIMQISDTHFRFSVGLEDPEDLINDLEQALKKI